MAVVIKCPDCAASLKLATGPQPGKKVRCPRCTKVFVPTGKAASGAARAIVCPKCAQKLKAGNPMPRSVKCPKCQTVFRPGPSPAAKEGVKGTSSASPQNPDNHEPKTPVPGPVPPRVEAPLPAPPPMAPPVARSPQKARAQEESEDEDENAGRRFKILLGVLCVLGAGVAIYFGLSMLGGPPQGSVAGTVTYHGKPVPGGQVAFIPADGTPVLATTDGEGKYEIRSMPVGDASITVTRAPEEAKKIGMMSKDEKKQFLRIWEPKGMSELPNKYRLAKTSPLRHKVQPGVNTSDLRLED